MSHWVNGSMPSVRSMSCSIRLKAAVPGGAPDQASGGDSSAPSQVYWTGSLPPALKAGLCSAKGWAAATGLAVAAPGDGEAIGLARGKLGVGPAGVGRLGWGEGVGSAGGLAALQPTASRHSPAAAIHRRIAGNGNRTRTWGAVRDRWHAFCRRKLYITCTNTG